MSCVTRYMPRVFTQQNPNPIWDRFEERLQGMRDDILSAETRAEITFWGERVVWIRGQSGKVSLDSLKGAIGYAGRWENVQGFDAAQRVAGLDIVAKLQTLRESTDSQLANAWFFTRIFVWLREFEIICGPRIPYNYSDPFRLYTQSAMIREFSGHVEGADRIPTDRPSYEEDHPLYGGAIFPLGEDHPLYGGAIFPPSVEPRYWVREAHIRAAASRRSST